MTFFSFPGETLELNDQTRSGLPGCFVRLSDGVTHYELAGPPDGSPVVLVHGFSVPFFIWDPTFLALVNAGFRVLRYDLFGRGFSDRPKKNNEAGLFVRQLDELVAATGLKTPLDLAGLSMGGPVSVHFTAAHPESVARLCLVDPAGLASPVSFFQRFLKIPLLGELLMAWKGRETLISGLESDFHNSSYPPEYREKYLEQMQFRGFLRSLLSTLRGSLLGNSLEAYRQVGRLQKPVLLIWGRQDRTVPFQQSNDVLKAIPTAQLLAVDDAGHVPYFEKPEIVNPKIIRFFCGQ